MRRIFLLATTLLFAVVFASAATLTGTVNNLTTGKPSAGDEVALLALSQGMNGLAHTKTDASGKFSFNLDDPNVPHLVRVTHDGVNYFPAGGPVRPGTSSVNIDVYDGARKVDGISTTVDVLRVQGDGNTLQVLELIAVNNTSKPPRALNTEHTYQFYLPPSAQFDQMMVQSPGGMPVNLSPVPDKAGKYFIDYALKPGETRFEIAYHLPYSGQASFVPKLTDNVQHFVVMMPKSMTFEAKDASRFSLMNDSSANIQVATQVTPATDLRFRVSGSGVLADDQQGGQQQSASSASGGAMNPDDRPGGGLGPPIDAPDPLHNSRWLILGGLAIVLIAGGVFVVNRANQQGPAPAAPAGSTPVSASVPNTVTAMAPAGPSVATDRASVLLDGLKDELFQLEIERQQGRISAEEYERTKAALDETLRRALSRRSNL